MINKNQPNKHFGLMRITKSFILGIEFQVIKLFFVFQAVYIILIYYVSFTLDNLDAKK